MDPSTHPHEPSRYERLAGGIDIWLAPTSLAREPVAASAYRALLTEPERRECDSFHHEADRRRAVVTRALVRTTLSRYVAVPPEAWRFERPDGGRPEIEAPAGSRLRFNLSHTRELVACAVTIDADVGVDVELESPHADLVPLAETVFSEAEFAAFRGLPPELRRERFYATWTLKEAYLKARGLGLALPPRNIGLDLSTPGRITARLGPDARDEPESWWFGLLRADVHHVLAVAAKLPRGPRRLGLFLCTPPLGDFRSVVPDLLAASSPLRPPQD